MNKLFTVATLCAASILSGCDQTPLHVAETDNPEIDFEVLVERNECEIGRFEDDGRNIHVTLCPETGASMTQYYYKVSCGKNCTKTVLSQYVQAQSPYNYFDPE